MRQGISQNGRSRRSTVYSWRFGLFPALENSAPRLCTTSLLSNSPHYFSSQFFFSMALPTTSNSYGSLGDVDSGSAPHYAGQETSPLLGPKRRARSLRKWMNTEISRDRADVVLLLSYIITGLLDSASISTWGTFVSMQTGT